MVGVERFELPALWSQTRCATRLRYTPTEVYLDLVQPKIKPRNTLKHIFSEIVSQL